MVPADGVLLGDPALVDESLICGVAGLSWKKAGEPVYAGSISIEGRIELEVSAHGESTRAARLGRELAAAGRCLPTGFAVTPHGEEFGKRAVTPTLGGRRLGLLVGDLTTASAILRPDYATGPGLGVSLESLRDVAECAPPRRARSRSVRLRPDRRGRRLFPGRLAAFSCIQASKRPAS